MRPIFDGQVVYADHLKGFGKMLILDHGEGWYSLYGRLESFAAIHEQEVRRNQTLAFVGDSDSTKGAYLYLEIRKGKNVFDPLAWLAP